MGYSKEIYDLAWAELKKRKTDAYAENDKRLNIIKMVAPDVYEAEQRVRNTFFSLTQQLMGRGGDPKAAIQKIEQENLRSQQLIKDGLKRSGYPEDFLEIPYHCKKCKDTGSIDGRNCECFTELLKKYAASELNRECTIKLHTFDDVKLSVYEQSIREKMGSVIKYAKDYSRKFGGQTKESLLLIGGTGTGKTLVSSCIASSVVESGFAVCFATAFELFNKMENERFGKSSGDTMSTALTSDLLIIDDLGAEFKSKFSEAALYNILNSRINMERPTIVSTNLAIDELMSRYNDRIYSRILGNFTPLVFVGKDIRMNKIMNLLNT